jgi:uncharacterized protein
MKKLLLFLILTQAGIAYAASFDCNKASSKSEKLICSDQQLSQLDSELGKLYAQAKASATDADAFKNENIKRWKEREENCSDKQCLLNWYAARKVELSKWVNQSNNQQASKPDSSASSTTELANILGKCSGSYRFASMGQDDPSTKNILAKSSDLSLQVANSITKIPYPQLTRIRDEEVDKLIEDFKRISLTKDSSRIIAWGNSIGERNNKCTAMMQKIFDGAKK